MDSPNPFVSVILPFYNAPFLKESIESILNQTYTNFELILIDNGSSDESTEIAKSYTKVLNVRILNEPKRGVVFAANCGLKHAKGELIARMDADDISDSCRLENQVRLFEKNPMLGMVSGKVKYLGPEQNEGFIEYVNWLNSIQTPEEIHLNQFVEFPIANPSMMIRKKLFDEYGYYKEGDFPEDYEFFLRLQAGNVQMAKADQPVIAWRDTETRLTRSDNRYSQDSFFRIKAKYLAKWLRANNPNHPEVYIWGAGRLSRRRSDYLLKEGIEVRKYIDLKESSQVLHYESLPESSKAFIVSYVGNRGARSEIRTFLNEKGFIEGLNYIMAS